MFSNRIEWALEPNELSVLLGEKRRVGAPLLDLTESNPTKAGFHYPNSIFEALSDPKSLVYEPTPWGLDRAREAAAAEHGVPSDRVMLTASTSESYSYLFKLLCSPGDNVLVPKPSYPLFEFLAKLEAVQIQQYSLDYEDGWRIDFDELWSLVDSRTRAILLVNPNNPTGSYLHEEELPELYQFCEEHSLSIVSDEVFWNYPLQESKRANLTSDSPVLTFQLSGLSKMAGLPQMKAGWIVLGGPEQKRQRASELLEVVADTFLSVSTPVQHALPELLRDGAGVRTQIHRRCQENLEHLQQVGSPLIVEGGWYAIQPIQADEYETVLYLVREHNVQTQPGFFYDFDAGNQLVLSLLAPPEIFREGLERIAKNVSFSGKQRA